MDELRRFWLPSDWASELRLKMLSSRQGSCPFHEWVVDVQTQNSILVNDTAHMSDANLRYHFEAHMHKDLAIEYCTSDAKDETDLCKWIEKVKRLNKKRQHEACSLCDQIESSLRALNRPCNPEERRPTTDSSTTRGPKAPTGTNTCLPALTDDE